jgi:two-component system chemotaxis response regulator CheB
MDNASGKITVLVVDDSLFFRTVIMRALTGHPYIRVVGTAASALQAKEKLKELAPDVMTLDVEMPGMNGIDFLKELMPKTPMPVVVVSAVNGIVFEAFKAGAVDFVVKPSMAEPANMDKFLGDLAGKIRIASKAKLRAGGAEGPDAGSGQRLWGNMRRTGGLIALGASTGGTEATSKILKRLPASLPGMVITQHMPPVFTKMYANRLNGECALEVKEAEDGETLRPGHVYIAPGDRHMSVVKSGSVMQIRCQAGEKVNGHCPSVDVLFHSVAKFADKDTVGIILTGMGQDGAKGLLAMRNRNAFTVGQDEKSCVVYGMPAAAFRAGAVARQAPLEKIADIILEYFERK